jgi:hypothetical protein
MFLSGSQVIQVLRFVQLDECLSYFCQVLRSECSN